MKNVISSSLVSLLILLIIATGFFIHRYCNPGHSNVRGAAISDVSLGVAIDSASGRTEVGVQHLLVIRK